MKYQEKRSREISRFASDGYVEFNSIIELEEIPLTFLEKEGVLERHIAVPQGFDDLWNYRPSSEWGDRIRTGKLIPLFIEQRAAKELVDRWRACRELNQEMEAKESSRAVAPERTNPDQIAPELPRRVEEADSQPSTASKHKNRVDTQDDSSVVGMLSDSPIPAGIATVASLVSLHHYLTESFTSVGYVLFALVLLVVPGIFVLSGSKELLKDRLVTWIRYTVGVVFVWFVVLRTPMRGL